MVYDKYIDHLLDERDGRLAGEEKVSGRECYVLEIEPKKVNRTGNEGIIYRTPLSLSTWKLWIGKEFYFPLRIEWSSDIHEAITEYRDVEFNTGIKNNRFEINPPEDNFDVRGEAVLTPITRRVLEPSIFLLN